MSKFVARFLKDESGATAVEYGLIVTFIAAAIAAAATALGEKLTTPFTTLTTAL